MKREVIGIICIVAACVGGIIAAEAYYPKTLSGFYRSDFTQGIAVQGKNIISSANIGFNNTSECCDSGTSSFKYSLTNEEVVLMHTHGAPGLVTLSSSTTVTGSDISGWNGALGARLFYISSCETGTVSQVYGDLPAIAVGKGVYSVVSFRNVISASSDYNGIHNFNRLAITNMTQGYGLTYAMSRAYTTFSALCNNGYYGADSYRITGNYYYMMNHS